MKVTERLASSLGRRDEEPNMQLAGEIAEKGDKEAVKQLMEVFDGKNKHQKSDAIKVLYETGSRNPSLIAPYLEDFLGLLESKDNRLQWGAMTALASLAVVKPKELFNQLPLVLQAAESGSVITRDQALKLMIALYAQEEYAEMLFPEMLEVVIRSPENQLPMYAEEVAATIGKAAHASRLIEVIRARLPEVQKESKVKRLQKVLNKLEKLR